MGTVLRTIETSDISVISEQGMLAYKDSKVPANLRNVKFNTCQKLPVWSHFERRNHRMMKEDDSIIPTGWHPTSQLIRPEPLVLISSALPGAFRKKNIQKRWEDFRLKSVEGLWPWTSWTLPNTKTQDLGFIVSLFLVYHNFYASPMCNFFWYEVSEKTPRPVEKLPRGLEGRYQITLRDSVA